MRYRSALLLLVVVVGFAATRVAMGENSADPATSGTTSDAQAVAWGTSASYTWAGATSEEWATNADHVIDVTMTGETPGRDHGYLQERIGTFEVNEVLSSRESATRLPTQFGMRVAGWAIDQQTDDRTPLVLEEGLPRLEPGHHFVLAPVAVEPRCNPDDGIDPGGWPILTPKAALPFDDAVLGEGEVEGGTDEELAGYKGSVAERVSSGEISGVDELVEEIVKAPELQPGDRIGC